MRKDGKLVPLLPSAAPFEHLINAPASSPPVVETSLDGATEPRLPFLLWLLQTGEFTDYLTGEKGLGAKLAQLDKDDRGAALPDTAKALYPNVVADKAFPPTFFVSESPLCLVHCDSKLTCPPLPSLPEQRTSSSRRANPSAWPRRSSGSALSTSSSSSLAPSTASTTFPASTRVSRRASCHSS